MIYITGDTHGGQDSSKLDQSMMKKLTEKDFLVICGDTGLCWLPTREQAPDIWREQETTLLQMHREEHKRLQWLSDQKWTTLFVDGNHENFPRLYHYPVKNFHGGKAGQLAKKVWHLRRGEVYTIDGKKIFTMGGATSIDKTRRTPGISWWPEEVPSDKEWANAKKNLADHGWHVDYVFTHCPPESIREQVPVHF